MVRRGFTLIEILVVVIILGILGAIVIPQFTNASNDARTSSLTTTLQTVRSQIEFFKMQHADRPPTLTAVTNWQLMLTTSNTTETDITSPQGTAFGPYMPTAPRNPMNGQTAIGNTPSTTVGWVYMVGVPQNGTLNTVISTDTTNARYILQAVNTTGNGVLTY